MILATASALHGHNTLGRWYLAAISAVAYSAAFYFTFGLWGLTVFPSIALWWVLFRGSRTENIENDFMHQGGNGPATLHDVLKAHYYTGMLSCLSLMLFNYSTERGKKLGWEHLYAQQGHVRGTPVRVDANGRVHPDDRPFWDCRRPTEVAGGLTADIVLVALLVVL